MSADPAVYSLNNLSGTGTGDVIDIADCTQGLCPPVMHVVISATATVLIEGSHSGTVWVDYSNGGLTSSDGRDLVIGVRFWRARCTANTGLVTAEVGPVPTQKGGYVSPHLQSVSSFPSGI